MESVFAQTFTDYEYIIIDGGSTDGSKELIEKHQNKLVYWVSEKDNGIYDAMNKGINNSSGEYLLFLNSGDYLYDESVLGKVAGIDISDDIIYGNVKWEPGDFNGIYPDILTLEHFMQNTIPHQGSFIRKSLFNTIGLYDEQNKIISDWTFFLLALFKFNCSYKHVDVIVTYCNTEGISLKPETWGEVVAARQVFVQKHFPAFAEDNENLQTVKPDLNATKNKLNLANNSLSYRMHKRLRNLIFKVRR